MGDQQAGQRIQDQELRTFTKALLDDVQALEHMLTAGMFESKVRRIGAEQEIFLVNSGLQPAPIAMEMMKVLEGGPFTTELGQYNLEINLAPQELRGDGLLRMEEELRTHLARAQQVAHSLQSEIVLTGILPTLTREHLSLDYMTPVPRYRELNRVLTELAGGTFPAVIKGLDELRFSHDNVMLEACNTSFQIHFQVGTDEFARLYNLAQAVTGPILAAAVNSPVLLQHRLWKETRVALFQQSLDARSKAHKERGKQQRVSFGESWVEESVLEIFREDIARYRVLIAADLGEPSLDLLERGEIPRLSALCLHNGTVYRWNRPCYGVKNGVPHLRIENRALPAGPSVIDEIANAAFFFGLMSGMAEEYADIREVISFDDAKWNFMAAARYGLKAQLHWLGGDPVTAGDLLLNRLLPQAREGLRATGVDENCIERYLGVVEERIRRKRTGASWAFDSLVSMEGGGTKDGRYRGLVVSMIENQRRGDPIHLWPLAALDGSAHLRESYRTVAQVMTTDLFTVHPEDLVDLAASLMDWEHLRHVPVEDHEGQLVGLVSHRALLRLVGRGLKSGDDSTVAVRDIMELDPVTVTPETTTVEAIERMRNHKVSCLPVVSDGKLVGLVSEGDFLGVAAQLLDEWLRTS